METLSLFGYVPNYDKIILPNIYNSKKCIHFRTLNLKAKLNWDIVNTFL